MLGWRNGACILQALFCYLRRVNGKETPHWFLLGQQCLGVVMTNIYCKSTGTSNTREFPRHMPASETAYNLQI